MERTMDKENLDWVDEQDAVDEREYAEELKEEWEFA
jgi:hypothetical protein